MKPSISLEVKDLTIAFAQQQLLKIIHDLNFKLYPGKTLGVVGESGSGKSLTALGILRLLPLHAVYADNTQIMLQRQDLLNLAWFRMREIRGKKISMIFQEPMLALNPLRTLFNQLKDVILAHQNMSARALENYMMQLMDDVELTEMKAHVHQYPHQWSGGQKQRFMIAMALANRPEIILADEPTTALDLMIQSQILKLLKKVQQQYGIALLLISHDFSVIRDMADEVLVMYAGEVIEHASADDFWQQPKHPYVHQLMNSRPSINKRGLRLSVMKGQVPSFADLPSGCRFHPRCAYAMDICRQVSPQVQYINQHLLRCHLYPMHKELNFSADELIPQVPSAKTNDLILGVEDLWVLSKHGQKSNPYVLQALSFPVYRGRVLAIVGESGSGKSTLAATLLGFLPHERGNINYHPDLAVKDIQIVFQDPSSSLNPRWLIQDILQEACGHGASKKLRRVLEAVHMPHSSLKAYPHELSGGQRQRICIARALLAEPKLLICDEPTSALDISVQAQILNLLQDLQQDLGFTCIFITHDLEVVSYIADDLLILRDGKMVEYGSLLDVWYQPKMQYTQQLLAATKPL